MWLIVHKERPHPGVQLRITDAGGIRITCFATNAEKTPAAQLELRHRRRTATRRRSETTKTSLWDSFR